MHARCVQAWPLCTYERARVVISCCGVSRERCTKGSWHGMVSKQACQASTYV